MRFPAGILAMTLMLTVLVPAAPLAAAEPGDSVIPYYDPPCAFGDPTAVTFANQGLMVVAKTNAIWMLHPDGSCAATHAVDPILRGITYDAVLDLFWVSHRAGFSGPVSVATWTPALGLQHQFSLGEVDGRTITLTDVALDPFRNELWFSAWASGPRLDAVLVHTTLQGEVLRVEDLPSTVRGVAFQGPRLWVASDDLAQYVPPPPGMPWPEPVQRIPLKVGRGLAFDPSLDDVEHGAVGCAFWTVQLGWPNHLAAYEAACDPMVALTGLALASPTPAALASPVADTAAHVGDEAVTGIGLSR